MIKSPLNYIGGKYKILNQILPYFPNEIDVFYDLFCGGLNVGVNVTANKYIYNDNLKFLIELYEIFHELKLEDILKYIDDTIQLFDLSKTNKEGYLMLRTRYNDLKYPLDLFVLTAFSFNHQIRFNNSHQYNNPFGKDRSSFNPNMRKNLINFIEKIQNQNPTFTMFNFMDFDFDKITTKDFIYCDPPYLITTGSYNDGKRGFTDWGNNEEKELLNKLDYLNNRNIKFALSNVISHHGATNNILNDWIEANNYKVCEINISYKNSNYQKNNPDTSSREVLIINY